MIHQLPSLLVIAPLLAALLAAMAHWVNRRWCFPLVAAGLAAALASAVGLLVEVIRTGPFIYRLGGWDPPIGIAYAVDYLNAPVLVVIAGAALVNLIASYHSLTTDFPEKLGPMLTLYSLASAGLLGMVVTGDAFNLYVLLEIASLTGYALVAMAGGRAYLAGLNYVFMGTIGASFYLLGVGFLYIKTGTLNMADLALRLGPLTDSPAVFTALAMIMVGLWLKMAFFPLHGWLPAAYSLAPSASAGLLAPLTTKVMVYVMIRMIITVFGLDYVFSWSTLTGGVVWLADLAIVAGAALALAQRNLRRMLAYIIVAEVGYMVGGVFLGNQTGMTGAVLHLLNDALMTLCVFLAAGALTVKLGGLEFKQLRGAFQSMPWTMAGLATGALAIIGVPPTGGFFSKWYLVSGAIEAGRYDFAAALIFSSLVGVVLFFRVFEQAYYPDPDQAHGHDDHGHHAPAALAEAPLSAVAPLLITAAALVAMGLMTGPLVRTIITPALGAALGGGAG